MKKMFYALPLFALTANCFAVDARSYTILPKDFNLAEIQYYSVSTEKLLPNTATVDHDAQSINLRYVRSFAIGDTLAAAYIVLPYAQVDATANIGPMKLREKHTSPGDVKLFFGVGTYNMPALSKEEYAKYDKNGVKSVCSTALTIPTGSYSEANLFNVGTNLYSLRGECIVSYTQDKLVAEFISGVTGYSSDKNVAGTKKRTQKDLYQTEAHITYNITPDFWSGIDIYYQNGGEQTINNISAKDKLDNTLIGLVGNYKIAKGMYLKANYLKTVSSPKYAAKSDYLVVSLQQLF
jgi:hypothetical protein